MPAEEPEPAEALEPGLAVSLGGLAQPEMVMAAALSSAGAMRRDLRKLTGGLLGTSMGPVRNRLKRNLSVISSSPSRADLRTGAINL
ncbi:hypothetical protein GCM10028815_32100 [Mariniluteicoccus flavus]